MMNPIRSVIPTEAKICFANPAKARGGAGKMKNGLEAMQNAGKNVKSSTPEPPAIEKCDEPHAETRCTPGCSHAEHSRASGRDGTPLTRLHGNQWSHAEPTVFNYPNGSDCPSLAQSSRLPAGNRQRCEYAIDGVNQRVSCSPGQRTADQDNAGRSRDDGDVNDERRGTGCVQSQFTPRNPYELLAEDDNENETTNSRNQK